MERSDIDFKNIPDAPGVYFFRGSRNEILYAGKATSLRDRVKSYFGADIAEVRSPLIEKIVRDAVSLEYEQTDSVLEALILEAKFIKKYTPIGNTDQKDDKSWNFVVITNEEFPRVLVARERELNRTFSQKDIRALFGPFPAGGTLREGLKIIRKIFPFFDTRFPVGGALTPAQKKTIRFNQSIGLYPTEFDAQAYRKSIRAIIDLFSARKDVLIRRLEYEMTSYAIKKEFEKAEEVKRQVFALKHIQDVTLIKEDLKAPTSSAFRIEAYDTAHLRGEGARAVMAVVENGEAVPSEYRTFTIRDAKPGDDFAALDEVLSRRAKHREWQYAQLIVIDGGRAHLQRAKKTLADVGMSTDVVAVVKDEKHRPREILGLGRFTITHEAAILLANSEAHRFAIGKHRRALRRRFEH